MKLMHVIDEEHPFPVIRVYELMKWVQSGDYENILRGYYAKSATQPLTEDVKEAADNYKKGFRKTFKPLEEMFNDMKDTVQQGATQGKNPFDMFDEWRKKNKDIF